MKIFRKGNLSEKEIHQWLLDLRGNPHVPESGFDVSAVFRVRAGGQDDLYFAGVNAENIDHRLSSHGEEGVISAMVTALGKKAELVEGWVMGAPRGVKPGDATPFADMKASCCGKCRQQVAGFAAEDVKVHSFSLNGDKSTTTVGAFLPDLFSFRQYIPEILEKKAGDAAANEIPTDIESLLIRKGPLKEAEIEAWLRDLESVDYASNVSQSVVVKLDNGYYVAGTKVEEAAFVSINAAMAAAAISASEFGGGAKIEEAWVYTKGRAGKELPKNAYGTLPLSAVQTLAEFSGGRDIPLYYLGDQSSLDTTLFKAARLAPVSQRRYPQIGLPKAS